MTICVAVIGLVGLWCSDHPEVYGIGECTKAGDSLAYCTASIDEILWFASYYDPREMGTNCYYDPATGEDTCDYLGDGTPTDTAYGWAMACPLGMYGTTVEFEYIGTRACRDHGGAIHPTFDIRWTGESFEYVWYIPFDFLLLEPEWWTYGRVNVLNMEWGLTDHHKKRYY